MRNRRSRPLAPLAICLAAAAPGLGACSGQGEIGQMPGIRLSEQEMTALLA